jgi:hypothetical protein
VRDDSLLVPAIAIFAVIISFLTWPFIAIFIHELGHAAAARLVGLKPTHLIVGHPDENDPLFSLRVFGCSVECWPLPFGGATLFAKLPTDRLKMLVIAIGGPLIDVLVIFVSILLWQHAFSIFRVALALIILSQAINILRNLIPVSSQYAGVRVPSDGKVLLQLLARRRQT